MDTPKNTLLVTMLYLLGASAAKDAKRVISPIRSVLEPHSGDFAGATMKWARDRERKIKTRTEGKTLRVLLQNQFSTMLRHGV
jgi:hypothetical protein